MQHKWHKIRIMLFNLKRYEPIRAYTTSLKSVNEYKLIRLVPPYACEWTLLTAGCGGGWESKHWPIAWPGSLSITWDVVMYYGELPGGIPGNSWWGCATRYSRSWPYCTTSSPGRFSWLWRWGVPPPKPGKRALGTRLPISDQKIVIIHSRF